MEMMVVLLIVAIVAAASAPMVTKKLSRNAGTVDSPWVFTGLNNNIAFLGGNNGQVLIGSATRPGNANQTSLYIAGRPNWSHIGFGNENNTSASFITYQAANVQGETTRIGLTNVQNIPNNSIMLGGNQNVIGGNLIVIGNNLTAASPQGGIVIGTNARTKGALAISIGTNAIPSGSDHDTETYAEQYAIAIGSNAKANNSSVAFGMSSKARGVGSIAIGYGSNSSNSCSIALGDRAEATFSRSVAIGNGATTTTSNQIVLGTEKDTVYIPGRLVVDGQAVLGNDGSSLTRICTYGAGWIPEMTEILSADTSIGWVLKRKHVVSTTDYSDRRLKNVGKSYTAGLEELKKLDFFHYTFKDDKAKTPRVGVMAQDLQKVFPDAVTEGEDGYLRIRMEDMFYAVINAIKELDTKIASIVEDITGMKATIEVQQTLIEELQKQNAEFEKRLKKLEKRN